MEAIMVKFELAEMSSRVEEILTSHDRSMRELPGYVVHVWLRRGYALSLLSIFNDRTGLCGYLNSRLPESLTAHPAWSAGTQIAHFKVMPAEHSSPLDDADSYQLLRTGLDVDELAGEPPLRVADERPAAMRPGFCGARRSRQDAGRTQPILR